jgi:hypothetical protein
LEKQKDMRQTDIERLKDICEKEGFQVIFPGWDENIFLINKKDHWEGVEFAECVSSGFYGFRCEIVYRRVINRNMYQTDSVWNDFGNKGSIDNNPIHFKPSTEAAYVSQLKEKAKELYGEIQDGDRFDFTDTGFPEDKSRPITFHFANEVWSYKKELDRLYFRGFSLYQNGKWAKKIERVRVQWKDWGYLYREPAIIQFDLKLSNINWDKVENKDDIGEYLAKCLEDKLNEAGS